MAFSWSQIKGFSSSCHVAKDRFVIRLLPATNVKELLHRVFYSKRRLVEPALALLLSIRKSRCVEYDIVRLRSLMSVREDDVEYVVKKLRDIGLVEVKGSMICLSDKFVTTLSSLMSVWLRFLREQTE